MRPTPLGRQLSGRYREIMVDEYQDSNEVQNCIFRAISRDRQNLFTVGDVKQSIYRFRLADPTIFSGEISGLPTGRGGRGGAATKGAAEARTSAPGGRCFRLPTLCLAASCPGRWERWTTGRRNN